MITSIFAPLALGCAAAALLLIILSLTLHLFASTRTPWHSKLSHSSDSSEEVLYADSDGVATSAFFAAARDVPQRILLGFLSFALGALVVTHLAFFARQASSWLDAIVPAALAGLALHAAFTARCPIPADRFRLGLATFFVGLAAVAAAVLDAVAQHLTSLQRVSTALVAVAILLASATAVTAITFSPRPMLVRGDRQVDGQNSASILSRYTFAWSYTLINIAHEKPQLDEKDLPLLDAPSTSEHLKAKFEAQVPPEKNQSLWLLLFKLHWATLVQVWSVALIETCVTFIPELAMFSLLKVLELRQSSHEVPIPIIAFWIAVLGVSSFAHNALEGWLFWIKWSILELTVRVQLKNIIVAKAMRLDHVKEPSKSGDSKETSDDDNAETRPEETTPLLNGNAEAHIKPDASGTSGAEEEEDEDDDDDEDNGNGRSVINLVDIDAETVSVNAPDVHEVVASSLKLIIGLGFLVAILGWQATLAGIAIPLLLAPLHKISNSKYTEVANKTSRARDNMTSVLSEALHGMRQIKFGALERQWHEIIMAARKTQLKHIWHLFFWRILITVLWMVMPSILGAAALATYALIHGTLQPSVAFTALAVFGTTEQAMSTLPNVIPELADAYVSLNRISDFLKRPDRAIYTTPGDSISMQDATISWPTADSEMADLEAADSEATQGFTLRHVNLDFPNDGLTVIHGKTGSGKSLLLASLVNEARLLDGRITSPPERFSQPVSEYSQSGWLLPFAKAFVPQQPWLENASLRDNVLYGLPFNKNRYQRTIHACALEQDLTILHDGDQTEIGASGVNLSGGQKWRLTLARALYSRAGILVLDDIFSAVDSHVGHHILEHAILGELGSNRTIILATHHIDLATPVAQYVVEIDVSGEVKATVGVPRKVAQPSLLAVPDVSDGNEPGTRTPRRFVEEEHRAEGQISLQVYKDYVKASGGWWFWILILVIFTLSGSFAILESYWVKLWAESSSSSSDEPSLIGKQPMAVYVGVYISLSILSSILIAVKMTIVRNATLKASQELFQTLTDRVLHASLQWVDTVPVGRIINRLVGDFRILDGSLATFMAFFLDSVFQVMTVAAASILISPLTVLIVVPIVAGMAYVAKVYLRAARDVKRIELVSNSPIIDNISSALAGLSTIRSFGKIEFHMERMYGLLDTQSRANYHLNLLSSWLESRQSMLGSVFEVSIAIFVCFNPSINAAAAGFILSFAGAFSQYVMNVIQEYSKLDLDMNSVERVFEYLSVPGESQEGEQPPATWPASGKIDVRNLTITYASDLPPALRDVSFTIPAGKRVGIVGRTGSGKSSLTLALFRFLEAVDGVISIDGIDISKVRLADLRTRLSIIPQDPVLFTGTVRSNLDPFGKHEDAALFSALRQVSLLSDGAVTGTKTSTELFADLQHAVVQGGSNLSQGQRQLLCLARAMLGSPRVMLLDEATSAVDMETDAAIQQSIRSGFGASTLLVVAHRLSTIIDFDLVLVLGDGKVLEFGKPLELFKAKGAFTNMVQHSGDMERLITTMEAS